MSEVPVARMTCDGCGKSIKFPAARIGQTAKCPQCQNPLKLRDQSSPPAIYSTAPKQATPPPVLAPAIVATASPAIATRPVENDAAKAAFVQKRVAAGLFALFLFGPLGSHKFYLGLNTSGAIMAITSAIGIFGACFLFPIALIVVMATISTIEAVIYLTKSDDQFYEDYAIRKRQWF